ncbi:YciC family protein [Altericroceibacterium xinjiangense]|uniref:YciC family protein n=1 Tax=Altericroceibacterium xinjiangense TaxID=762261 RepID=UPI000F7FA98C|nr:YciC family protein [Altericroceibacterium xinjiangense]
MATSAAEVRDGQVLIGRVFSRAFSTVSANPLVTLTVAFIIGAIPSTAASFFITRTMFVAEEETGIFLAMGALGWIVSLAIIMLTQAALTRVTVMYAHGQEASLGECLRAGMAVLPQLMILALLIGIAVGIGMVFLIVPGVILYCIWAVATPAVVEERSGILGSLGRSRQLTKGFRWRVFGISLILVVLYYLLLAVLTAVDAEAITGLAMMQGDTLPLSFFIYTAALSTLTNLVWGTVQASLFVELREAKEGAQHGQLEHVFA